MRNGAADDEQKVWRDKTSVKLYVVGINADNAGVLLFSGPQGPSHGSSHLQPTQRRFYEVK